MSKKLYQYTILRQDGTKEVLEPCPKKKFDDFYQMLDCGTIEIIPSDYHKPEWKKLRATVYGDEEARFNSENYTNPHTLAIIDMVNGQLWDCVGDLILEHTYKGAQS